MVTGNSDLYQTHTKNIRQVCSQACDVLTPEHSNAFDDICYTSWLGFVPKKIKKTLLSKVSIGIVQ